MARKQLIAISEIHLTTAPGKAANRETGEPGRKPKVKVIDPGTLFFAPDEKTEKELIKMNAVRVDESGDEDEDQVKDPASDTDAELKRQAQDDEEALRVEYEEVMGKPANGNMKVETMRKHIAEKREADANVVDAQNDGNDLV